MSNIVKTEILPPADQLSMPVGVPLGLGILGAAKFNAIRRVLEHAARAADAKANLHHSEAAVARALVGREVAREQLRNIDTICGDEADRIQTGARINKLARQLEIMEIEDRVAEATARRKLAGTAAAAAEATAPDEYQSFLNDLSRIPDILKSVAQVKGQIVANAGGEDKLAESDRATIEMLDAMMQAFMSKKAGDTVLT
jgi:hypothetical protein